LLDVYPTPRNLEELQAQLDGPAKRDVVATLDEAFDRRGATLDDANRTADRGLVGLRVVDAEDAADRGHEVDGADRPLDHRGRFGVGATNDLTAADASAGQETLLQARG